MRTHDISYVRAYYQEHGCELLEDTYIGNRYKMRFRCSCGEEYAKSFDNFQKYPRCRICGRKETTRKVSYAEEYVRRYFLDQGCTLLTSYVNAVSHVAYRCSCGRESNITFDNFLRGKRCRECGYAKIRGPGHGNWRTDREQKRLEDLFRKKCYKAVAKSLHAIGKDKIGHTTDLLGYSPKQLQEHIEKHPNWNKVKNKDWHLDHIFPIQAFVDYGIEDMALINALDNLRPLTRRRNLSKGHKYNNKKFKEWLRLHGRFDV